MPTPEPAAAELPPEPTAAELGDAALGCACTSVRRVARALTRAYDAALRPSGINITQFSVLVGAALADGPPISRLADILGLERTTLTRDLRRLRERGLVDVGVGEDRRARTVAITEAGRRALADALPRWREAQARVLDEEAAATWPELAGALVRLERRALAA